MTNMLTSPRCHPEDLGKPIPDAEHAVSVCMPLWEHNVGYEENDPRIIKKLSCGYPRFFLHPLVVELFQQCEARFSNDQQCCFAFPSRRVAQRCAHFIKRHTGQTSMIDDFGVLGIVAVCLPTSAKDVAMAYWKHAGEGISSRLAQAAMDRRTLSASGISEKQKVRQRIADFTESSIDDVYLFPSGMAAIFAAYRAFQKINPNRRSVQFGFPYVDILKVQQKCSSRKSADDTVHLFSNGDEHDLQKLKRLLLAEPIMGLFCEFPGNPMLKSPDLQQLAELSRKHDFPLLVDDTLCACVNANMMPVADLLATSLTKFFSGAGDVMAGSLVLNADRSFYDTIKAIIDEDFEDILFADDAIVLEQNSRDFEPRVRDLNRTTEQLCEVLRRHPAVERIDYPKYQTTKNYQAFMKPDGGYGGLFSILLHQPAKNAPIFFDALQISKGPNLGTSFTLCCPYTILAHFDELDFVESCGVSQYLVRVSVGLEDPDWLIARFTEALDRVVSY